MTSGATTGYLTGNIPFLKVGSGPPVVIAEGLTTQHGVPRGVGRRLALASAALLRQHCTVYVVTRKRGLAPGESMAGMAGHLAAAIEQDIGGPVLLQGTSTGGSVSLQLAMDRSDLVRRLVLISSAYRLGEHGRESQREGALLIRTGDRGGALAAHYADALPTPLRQSIRFAAPVFSALGPDDLSDMLITIEAEDAFDVRDRLTEVTAPTLVIGGAADLFYEPELFVDTAAGVRDGRVHLFPGLGHVRASGSAATTGLSAGFLLDAL